MADQESERAARVAFLTATKTITGLTYQLELVTDLLRRIYQRLADAATKLEIAVDISEREDDGEPTD